MVKKEREVRKGGEEGRWGRGMRCRVTTKMRMQESKALAKFSSYVVGFLVVGFLVVGFLCILALVKN